MMMRVMCFVERSSSKNLGMTEIREISPEWYGTSNSGKEQWMPEVECLWLKEWVAMISQWEGHVRALSGQCYFGEIRWLVEIQTCEEEVQESRRINTMEVKKWSWGFQVIYRLFYLHVTLYVHHGFLFAFEHNPNIQCIFTQWTTISVVYLLPLGAFLLS